MVLLVCHKAAVYGIIVPVRELNVGGRSDEPKLVHVAHFGEKRMSGNEANNSGIVIGWNPESEPMTLPRPRPTYRELWHILPQDHLC